MASKNEAKVTFTAETADLNKSISSANSELTKLRSELKLNEAQAKSTGDSMDSLKDRARILGDEYAASQSKVDALSEKLEAARNIFGENSIEAQKLETQLNNARVAQERIAQQIEQTNAAMSQMESSSAQAASALGRMESEVSSQESELQRLKSAYNEVAAEQGEASDEARQLASQISKTSGELQESKSKLDSASTAADKFDRTLDQLGDSAQDAGSDFDSLDVALGNIVADMAGGAWDAVSGLEEETRQYRLEQSKLAAQYVQTGKATIDNASEVSRLSDEYLGFYRLTGDETLASTAVSNINAMGLEQSSLNDLLTAASGIWAQYGDSIPLDGLAESVNETANTGTVTGSLADALNWATTNGYELGECLSSNTAAQAAYNKAKAEGATNEDAFNAALAACTTEQERQQLITDTLYSAYGELGETYNTLSADAQNANQAQAELTDAQAQLADAIAPVQTQLTYLISDGMEWLANNLPIVTPLVAGLATAFAGFAIVNTVLPAIQGLVTTLSAAPTVLAAIGGPATIIIGVVAALAAGFVYLWNTSETFRNGVMTVWTTIQTVFGTLAEWFMTNVVTPIVTYFTGLQTQISTIWNGISQIVNAAITAVAGFIQSNMGTIQAVWNTVWGVISTVASTIWANIQTIINTALGIIQGIITTVLGIINGDWSQVWQGISQVASSIWEGIKGLVTNAINAVSSIISSVLSAISSVWSSMWSSIQSFLSGAWEGIKSGVSSGIDAVLGFFRDLPGNILSALGNLGSLLVDAGKSIIDGLLRGLQNAIGGVWDFVSGIAGKIASLKGPIPYDLKLLIPNGEAIMSGLGAGLDEGFETEVKPQLGDITGDIAKTSLGSVDLNGSERLGVAMDVRDAGMASLVGAIEDLADRVISIEIDGRQLARATASSADRVNGARQRLTNRGVSLA